MNDLEPSAKTSDGMSPDIEAIMAAANARTSRSRASRRSAARSRAEAEAQEDKARNDSYDARVDAGLLVLIALCWIGAGSAFYFI